MMTVPEAARKVGRDPETIRRWIRSGRLRARKVGTQHVIEEADLESLIEEGNATTVLGQGDIAEVTEQGFLVIQVKERER